MPDIDETKEQKPVATWAKIAVLIGLIFLLVICIILPVKIVPQTLSMLSSTISSIFIPKELMAPTTQAPENPPAPVFTQAQAPAPTPTAPAAAPKVSKPSGLADLEVRIISVGFLSENNTFVPSAAIYSGQQPAVKFQIINVGTRSTGTWGFSANLPSVTDSYYLSPLQQSLGPGDRIEYTLGFRNPTIGQNHFGAIVANPSNTVPEISKANNTASVNFPIVQ